MTDPRQLQLAGRRWCSTCTAMTLSVVLTAGDRVCSVCGTETLPTSQPGQWQIVHETEPTQT